MVGKSISDLNTNVIHSMRRTENTAQNWKEEYSNRARSSTSFHKKKKEN